ncbi:hypothetical protein P1P68_02105 [Streptomyces scabiei]|uniref:hypothetical protein n=1 Tax=Streptomyces scabiei TaxID=1930 RepID=UPI00298F78B9|nr:hypothetical protein [Streptomyces scabiei]MDW8803628.1 hypothetical protein [Streptomyces scabiei]
MTPAVSSVSSVSTGTITYYMNGLTARPGTHLAAIAAPTTDGPHASLGFDTDIDCRLRTRGRHQRWSEWTRGSTGATAC